jgi:hypothetical protein
MRPELVEGLRQAQPALRVVSGLVFLVAHRLELERAVRHIEMSAKAFAEPVQHLT